MSFWTKFFPNKDHPPNILQKQVKNKAKKREECWAEESIRLVVFKDHDVRGRCVVFDSKACKTTTDAQGCRRKGSAKRSDGDAKLCNDGNKTSGNQSGCAKPMGGNVAADTKMLGEMMFGSVAMTYKGSSLKVHSIRTPPQLMITQVFIPSKPPSRELSTSATSGEAESFDNSSYASTSSLVTSENTTPRDISSGSSGGAHASQLHSIAQSVPMAVPSPPHSLTPLDTLATLEPADSGIGDSMTSSYCYSNQTTPYASPSSSASNSANNSLSSIHRGASNNSTNSFKKRLRRSFETSLELPNRMKDNNEHHKQPIPASKRPATYGIGIVFSLPEGQHERNKRFEMFVFSHIMLIESHVTKLKLSLEKSLSTKTNLRLTEALDVFRQAVLDLYLAPRIKDPVWLSMMTLTSRKVIICQQFLKEFMIAKEKYDKNNKFLSTLLTGVLTHHLAWVPTVAPAGATHSGTYLQKHSAKWLDTLAKSHPYNPLWAQLGDMYGAIGFPLRLSRTIITGKKADVIKRLLYIMTYFIRCSQVFENIDQSEQLKLDKIEYSCKSEEINIPESDTVYSKTDGSAKSGQSFQTQISCCVCTQCGKAIDNSGSFDPSQPRSRLNSRGRLKSPSYSDIKSPSYSDIKSPTNCDDTKTDLAHKKAIMKLMKSMDITTNERVCTEGVRTITASQSACRSPPFTHSHSSAASHSNQTEGDVSPILPKSYSNVVSKNESECQTKCDVVVNDDRMTSSDGDVTPPVTSSNTVWYVTLEEMGVYNYNIEPITPALDSIQSIETVAVESGSDSFILSSAAEMTSETNIVETNIGAKSSELDLKRTCDNKETIQDGCFQKTTTNFLENGRPSGSCDHPIETTGAGHQSIDSNHLSIDFVHSDFDDQVVTVDSNCIHTSIPEQFQPTVGDRGLTLENNTIHTVTQLSTDDIVPGVSETDVSVSNSTCLSAIGSCGQTDTSMSDIMCSRESALEPSSSADRLTQYSVDSAPHVIGQDISLDSSYVNSAANQPRDDSVDVDSVENSIAQCETAEINPSQSVVQCQRDQVQPNSDTLVQHSGETVPVLARVSIGNRNDQIDNQQTADDVTIIKLAITTRMTASYRGLLENEECGIGDLNSAGKNLSTKFCTIPEPTPVPLYPTLTRDTIPEDTYSRQTTHPYVSGMEYSVKAKSASQLSGGVYPSLAQHDTVTKGAISMATTRSSCSLYPVLDLPETDKATSALNYAAMDAGRFTTNVSQIDQSQPSVTQRDSLSVDKVNTQIISKDNLATKSDVSKLTEHVGNISSNKSEFISCDSNISENLFRCREKGTIKSDERSKRTKSAPVEDSKDVNTDAAMRQKLLSCPEDTEKTYAIVDDSALMQEQPRIERVRYVGKQAVEHPAVLQTHDYLDVNKADRASACNADFTSTKGKQRPFDSGVSSLSSLELSDTNRDAFQPLGEIVGSTDDLKTNGGDQSLQTNSRPVNKVGYLRLESSDSLFEVPCPDDSELPTLAGYIERNHSVTMPTDVSMTTERNGNTRKSDSDMLYKRLISEGSVSVFDEYFGDNQPVELPGHGQHSELTSEVELKREICVLEDTKTPRDTNETLTSEQTSADSDQHSCHSNKVSSPVFEDNDPFERCSERSHQLHFRLLSSLSSELDASSLVTDSDLEGSVCNDCISKMERSSMHSVTPQGAKKKRVPYRKQTSLPAGTPGRCRSVTPTELNRRRCGSSAASLMHDTECELPESPTLAMQEVVMPSCAVDEPPQSVLSQECNFGQSLLADYSDHYMSDFVLHGTSDAGAVHKLHQDLTHSVDNPVLDERIAESVCIVADTDKWSVKLVTCQYATSDRVQPHELTTSRLVSDILDSLYQLCKLKMSAEFCLMHVEDRLQEVYFKSRMLSEYLKTNNKIDLEQLAAMLGFAESDIPLLLAVAGTHTPRLALGLI